MVSHPQGVREQSVGMDAGRCLLRGVRARGVHRLSQHLPQHLGRHVAAAARGIAAVRLERAKGIEPSYEAWEASVLPLNYARAPHSLIAFWFQCQAASTDAAEVVTTRERCNRFRIDQAARWGITRSSS